MSENNIDRYFSEYENLEIHELMLKDRPRQEAYIKAIMGNKEFFKDKIVLDVGAGTGILSAFCAQAGAKLVYAVEPTNLAKIALQVIEENGLTSVVKIFNSKIEDFILPSSAQKVDIIVSEWMGFYLLHEGMLDSVLFARDHFLKSDGLMFPNEAIIYVAPCSIPSLFDYWKNVDGIQMTQFASKLREQKSGKPVITQINSNDLLHEGVVLHWMDLKEITIDELEEISFKDVVATQVAGKHQGFCLWFDCSFPGDDTIILTTAPHASVTHWKQCLIVLPDQACEDLEEKSPIAFQILMKRNANDSRKYNLEIELLDSNEEEHPMPCNCYMTKCILAKAHLQSLNI